MPEHPDTALPCPRCAVDLMIGGIIQVLTTYNTYRFAVNEHGMWREVARPADTVISVAYQCGTCGAFIASPESILYAQLRDIIRSAR